VKTLKPGTMTAADFLNEAKAMHRLRHRKLVLLMGVCTNNEPYYIITELMVNGSLLEYLRKNKHEPPITFNVVVDMSAQVNEALIGKCEVDCNVIGPTTPWFVKNSGEFVFCW